MRHPTVNLVSESVITIPAHGIHTAFIETARALRASGRIDVVVNKCRRADITHVHTVGPYGVAHLIASKRSVVTAHVMPDSIVGSFIGGHRLTKAATRYLAWYYNLADVVIAVDQSSVMMLRGMGVAKPIFSIPNTVNVSAVERSLVDKGLARSKLGLRRDAYVVLGVGQLQPRKGIQAFFECARAYPQAVYVWVGGNILGLLADSLREMRRLASNPPTNVLLTGVVSRETVFEYYSAADLFFLPSRHENCSMAVLEAAAAGLPILLRDLPQHRGLLEGACLYGEESNFADLVRLCSADQELRTQLGVAAHSVARRFDFEHHSSKLLDVYRLFDIAISE